MSLFIAMCQLNYWIYSFYFPLIIKKEHCSALWDINHVNFIFWWAAFYIKFSRGLKKSWPHFWLKVSCLRIMFCRRASETNQSRYLASPTSVLTGEIWYCVLLPHREWSLYHNCPEILRFTIQYHSIQILCPVSNM